MAGKKKLPSVEECDAILKPRGPEVRERPGLSSGSTLLNLACTGTPGASWVAGTYSYFWGDSNSGKTYLTLSSFAEACRLPAFDKYRLVFDQPEKGAQMDLAAHFGRAMVGRLEPPFFRKDGSWGYSETSQDFYAHVKEALARGPCLYLLDSENALSSAEDEEYLRAAMKSRMKLRDEGKGGKIDGRMSDGKAKFNSACLRDLLPDIDQSGSVLIVIGQSRATLAMFGAPQSHSGGAALHFYAQNVVRSKVAAPRTVRVRYQDRHVGNVCQLKVERSRYTGVQATVQVPIYFESGVDDVGSCVSYLIDERHWPAKGKDDDDKAKAKDRVVEAPEFDFEGKESALAALIESKDREPELRELTARVWAEVRAETAQAVGRKRRYE